MKKSIITPSGDKIAYVEKGTGDPVILIHGFTGNTGAWTETVEKLGIIIIHMLMIFSVMEKPSWQTMIL